MGDAGIFYGRMRQLPPRVRYIDSCVGHHTKMGSSGASGDLSLRGQHKQMLQTHMGQLNTVGLACDKQHWCLYLDKIKSPLACNVYKAHKLCLLARI